MTIKKTHIFEPNTNLNILVAPLNWGLGHATRCIPIIKTLLKKKVTVLIASDGRALALLKKEFPNLKYIELPPYDIQYSGHKLGLVPAMLWQIPKILNAIQKEQKVIQEIAEKENITAIVSDNRYGCYAPKIPSIFVSHQLFLKMPPYLQFLESIVAKTQLRFIRHFSQCWIPDFPSPINSLSGDLAHKYPLDSKRFRFVGALSRMKKEGELPKNKMKNDEMSFLKETYDVIAVLSGPEPQRTLFEEMLQKQILQSDLKALIVRGITEKQVVFQKTEQLQLVNFLTAPDLNSVLLNTEMVIARSGYSTLMDLAALGKKAILIPTPGQTEQDYLADYFRLKGIFYSESQSQFNLERALRESEKYSGFNIEVEENSLLKEAIEELLTPKE